MKCSFGSTGADLKTAMTFELIFFFHFLYIAIFPLKLLLFRYKHIFPQSPKKSICSSQNGLAPKIFNTLFTLTALLTQVVFRSLCKFSAFPSSAKAFFLGRGKGDGFVCHWRETNIFFSAQV